MAKRTCEEAKRISIAFLKKKHYLRDTWIEGKISWTVRGNPTGNASIDIDAENTRLHCYYIYHAKDEEVYTDYCITLISTPCYFGGKRYWFLCPLTHHGVPCEEKAGVLYYINGMFGCRRCQNVSYESQQETHTGKWGNLRKFYQLEWKLSEFNSVGKVKYWRGQPTKRYRKILRDYARLEMLSSVVADTDFLL